MFTSLDREIKFLFLESFILLGWGRFIKFLSFSKVAQKIGEQMKETTYEVVDDQTRKILMQISQMLRIASKYTFWESECLVRAVAATYMLKRRGLESTLYLGTGKDENGKLIAHAWVRSGSHYITGFENMKQFTMVATFANFAGR